ncbi:MAG TPA: four helix bundle protein [Bacteroidales bacterium]|nr:four helix bundle protein [Bacteroidales bacterium]
MTNKEFGKKLEERTRAFAIRIIRLSMRLPNTVEGKIIRNQLTKAGSSIGANYREANRARSNADFKNKIKICESESNETCYWLEIIEELKWCDSDELKPVIIEGNELLAIFTSISNNLTPQVL